MEATIRDREGEDGSRESQIVAQLRRGDRRDLGELVDLCGEDLMRYLISILGHRESAEDIFQDTWVKVMERINRFRADSPFRPWLFRIARNRAYDHLRWARLRRLVKGRDDDSAPVRPELPAHDPFAERLMNRELAGKVLAVLPPKLREMLWLRFFRELSYDEIAAVCNIPLGTVKSRLKRALERAAATYRALEV